MTDDRANSDAITCAEAAQILGMSPSTVAKLVRQGRLHRVLGQFPSMSRTEVGAYKTNPVAPFWITCAEAARILGITRERARQLAIKGLLPSRRASTGRRWFRRPQIMVIANARRTRWHGTSIDEVRAEVAEPSTTIDASGHDRNRVTPCHDGGSSGGGGG